jgi:endonuclease/exonuclease/phosphatase family metal-dependent hydrolase
MAAVLGLSSWAVAAPIKIVSWNVEWFPGRYPDATPFQEREHMAEVRYALRRMKPDVLILVEVKNPEAVRKAVQVVPGLHLNTISSFEGRPQQIAIASRYPVRRGGQAPWVRFFTGPPRGFTFAELALPDQKCLQVYGVHLKSNRGPQIIDRSFREISAVQLTQFIDQLTHDGTCPSAGVVVGGDFNTNLDDAKFFADDSLRYMIGTGMYWPFASLKPDARKTWQGDSNYEALQFDHFVTVNVGAPVAQVLKTGRTSDHLPIEITIDTDDIKPIDVALRDSAPAASAVPAVRK